MLYSIKHIEVSKLTLSDHINLFLNAVTHSLLLFLSFLSNTIVPY